MEKVKTCKGFLLRGMKDKNQNNLLIIQPLCTQFWGHILVLQATQKCARIKQENEEGRQKRGREVW
jgi:hypothetical protein